MDYKNHSLCPKYMQVDWLCPPIANPATPIVFHCLGSPLRVPHNCGTKLRVKEMKLVKDPFLIVGVVLFTFWGSANGFFDWTFHSAPWWGWVALAIAWACISIALFKADKF